MEVILLYRIVPEHESAGSSKTLVPIYQSTWWHILQDSIILKLKMYSCQVYIVFWVLLKETLYILYVV